MEVALCYELSNAFLPVSSNSTTAGVETSEGRRTKIVARPLRNPTALRQSVDSWILVGYSPPPASIREKPMMGSKPRPAVPSMVITSGEAPGHTV